MKVPVTISVVFCTVVFVGSLGLLALTGYHLWNDNDSGNVPMEQSDEWITHVISLIPICVIFMLLCVFTLWTVLMNNKPRCFISVLILNFFCFIATIYFAVVFSNELDAPEASGELLFNRTKTSISNSNKTHWIPSWLDSIQLRSTDCCGILTFRDWEEFWPQSKSEIPKSCCKDPENKTMYCPADLSRIPYPGTPSMFMKTDTGCLDEINDLMKKNIQECFIYILLMCCIFGCAEIAYFVQFYKQYISKSTASDRYVSRGDKFFDDKGGPQGDDGLNLPNTETDSYLQLSGFTASLQTASSGSFQSSGIDPDTGDRTMRGPPATMDSFDPMTLGSTASSSGFGGRQQSMARMDTEQVQNQPQFRRPGFNGQTGSNTNFVGTYGGQPAKVDGYGNQNAAGFGSQNAAGFGPQSTNGYGNPNGSVGMYEDSQNQGGMSALAVASSSSEVDQFGQKKKKKHRHRDRIDSDGRPQRQDDFVSPDPIDDFVQPPVSVPATTLPISSSQGSLNEVGDQLADDAQTANNKDKNKKNKGFGINRKHH